MRYAVSVSDASPSSINSANRAKWGGTQTRSFDANTAVEAERAITESAIKMDKLLEEEAKEPQHEHDSDEEVKKEEGKARENHDRVCPHCGK